MSHHLIQFHSPQEKLSAITCRKLISFITHNTLGPSEATLALSPVASKPRNGFCNKLCGNLHAPHHQSPRAPAQAAPLTPTQTSGSNSASANPRFTFTLHLNRPPQLLESVTELAQFLHVQPRANAPGSPAKHLSSCTVIPPILAFSVDQPEKSKSFVENSSKWRTSHITCIAPVVVAPNTDCVQALKTNIPRTSHL